MFVSVTVRRQETFHLSYLSWGVSQACYDCQTFSTITVEYVAQNTWTSQKATSYTDNGEMVSPPVASVSSTCFIKMWQENSKAADIGHSQRRIFDAICGASGARKAYCGVEEKASFGLASFLASWTDRLRQLSRLQNSNYVIPETH